MELSDLLSQTSLTVACRVSCTPSRIQAERHDPQYLMDFCHPASGLQRCITATTSICQPTTPGRSTLPSTAKLHYWSAFQPTWYAVCSRCSTRRHDSSTICGRTTTYLMRWRNYTGCASQNASSPKLRF